jgi:hypothetical protein
MDIEVPGCEELRSPPAAVSHAKPVMMLARWNRPPSRPAGMPGLVQQ